ncbi:unnamed protein product [Lota lota]
MKGGVGSRSSGSSGLIFCGGGGGGALARRCAMFSYRHSWQLLALLLQPQHTVSPHGDACLLATFTPALWSCLQPSASSSSPWEQQQQEEEVEPRAGPSTRPRCASSAMQSSSPPIRAVSALRSSCGSQFQSRDKPVWTQDFSFSRCS